MRADDADRTRRPGMSSDVARLVRYGHRVHSDADLVAELRRAAGLIHDGPLTGQRFQAVSGLSTSTFLRRFGSWRQALSAAGLADRYSGATVSDKMRQQKARTMTDAELLNELRRIAARTGRLYVTRPELRTLSTVASEAVYIRRFGSWPVALTAAGLTVAPTGRYWTDGQLLANLRAVAERNRRPLTLADLDRPPSTITSHTYRHRYGNLRNALDAMNRQSTSGAKASEPQAQGGLAEQTGGGWASPG